MSGISDFPPASVSLWSRHRHWVALATLTLAISFGWFFGDGNVGIDLADEGYLWYGTLALRAGQVPVRDFQAYDPGRYVWTAAWSFLLGDGLLAMRTACVIFSCLGLTAALLVARRISTDWKFLLMLCFSLSFWMAPRFKVFEQSIALMGVYVAVLLLERPTVRRHFWVGVFVGLMAFMGRNHGLYQAVALGLVILLAARARRWVQTGRCVLAWVAGMVAGSLPQWAMLFCVHGYAEAYLAMLRSDVAVVTSLAIPVAWPWAIGEHFRGFYRVAAILLGFFFVAVPAFLAVAAWRIFRLGRSAATEAPVVVAAMCITLLYAHHTFSRPDYIHLAHSVPAMLVGVIALACSVGAKRRAWLPASLSGALLVLCTMALWFNIRSPAKSSTSESPPSSARLRGRTFELEVYDFAILSLAEIVSQKLARPDEAVLFLPHWPGLYAATGRPSPLRQLYFILPASPAEDAETVTGIERARVRWVLLQDIRLDGRDDLRFQRTNPQTFRYLQAHFAAVAIKGRRRTRRSSAAGIDGATAG